MFTDGITNKLVACQLKTNDCDNGEDIVLVRIYGNKTDLLIDRNAEVRLVLVLNYCTLFIVINELIKKIVLHFIYFKTLVNAYLSSYI